MDNRQQKLVNFIDDEFSGNIHSAAESTGVPYSTLYQIYHGNRNVGEKVIMMMEKSGFSYIFTEVSNDSNNTSNKNNVKGSKRNNIYSNATNVNFSIDEILNVPLYINPPVYANRGVLVTFDDIPAQRITLSLGMKLKQENIIAFKVTGDSMKEDGIKDNDIVICDKSLAGIYSGNITAT